MAYNYDPNLDPNQQNQQPGQGNTQVAGGSTVTSGGAQTNAAPAGAQQPYSGGFQNLQNYLTANQGDMTGQKFSQNLQNDVSNANQAQQQASDQFKSQVDANTVQSDKSLVDKAAADPYAYLHGSQTSSSQPSEQNSIDQAAQNAFQSQLNAKYNGPQNLSDYQPGYQQASGATQRAADEAKAAQSEGGRFALLQNYFGNGNNYSQGEKSLDNLLLQNNPQTQGSIQQANQNAQQAQSNFNQMQGNLGNYASQGIAATQGAQDYARNAIGIGANGQFGANSVPVATVNQLQQQANQINQANQKAYQDELAKESTMTGAYGVNQASYLSANPQQASVSNLASPDQVARVQALSDLSGLTNTYLPDASQAGTYNMNAPAYNFDQTRFASDEASAKAAWELAHTTSAPDTLNGQPVVATLPPGYFGYSPTGTKGGVRMG